MRKFRGFEKLHMQNIIKRQIELRNFNGKKLLYKNAKAKMLAKILVGYKNVRPRKFLNEL
jgi:hypothetical protein